MDRDLFCAPHKQYFPYRSKRIVFIKYARRRAGVSVQLKITKFHVSPSKQTLFARVVAVGR